MDLGQEKNLMVERLGSDARSCDIVDMCEDYIKSVYWGFMRCESSDTNTKHATRAGQLKTEWLYYAHVPLSSLI
jgi:hypothetical protein